MAQGLSARSTQKELVSSRSRAFKLQAFMLETPIVAGFGHIVRRESSRERDLRRPSFSHWMAKLWSAIMIARDPTRLANLDHWWLPQKKWFIVVPPKPLTPSPYPYTVLPIQSNSAPIHVVPAEAGGPNGAKDVSNCTQKGPASNRLERCWQGPVSIRSTGEMAKSWYGVKRIW